MTSRLVGKTEADGWLVLVASFLGDIHGDLDDVPVAAAGVATTPLADGS